MNRPRTFEWGFTAIQAAALAAIGAIAICGGIAEATAPEREPLILPHRPATEAESHDRDVRLLTDLLQARMDAHLQTAAP